MLGGSRRSAVLALSGFAVGKEEEEEDEEEEEEEEEEQEARHAA